MMRTMASPRTRARSGRATADRLGRSALAIGVLFAGLLLASAFVAIEAQRNAIGREAAIVREDIAAASARIAAQQAAIAEKETDGYVMDRARDYGYVRPGEALIGVRREPVAPEPAVVLPRPSHVDRWIALFIGHR